MTAQIIILSSALSLQSFAAVIRIPLAVPRFGGSSTITLTDNTGATIRFSQQTNCSRDIPSSSCLSSSIVSGGSRVQFLLDGHRRPLRLSGGETLSNQPDSGMWGANSLNLYEFLISRSSPTNGTFSRQNGEYNFAFRAEEAGGEFRYGWVEIRNDATGSSSAFQSVALGEASEESITVILIPEPSTLLLLLTPLLALSTHRRRTIGPTN